eukprot:TRINITY_DN9594_c0_g2_i3.p1 TRINITY_DN9594_c0_g2~~TRINITY_DN9594_c0_g2_i3.p1  ORF type:complete len:214 (-),score=61.18 TRINITY_DN9594_c0_g2_i3:53-694(-)
MLSEEMVRRASGQFDLSSVAVLTLPGLGLSGFEKGVLAQCTSLHTLDLSGNNLRDCPAALSECTALKRLDLSGNKITNLIGVELPSTIEELRIQGNQLSSAKDMKALSQLPNLQALYLRGADGKLPNPVCQANPEYPVCILELLPDLANLDGMRRSVSAYWMEEPPKMKPVALPAPTPWPELNLSLIHISEPTRLLSISYAVFCLKKKKKQQQ